MVINRLVVVHAKRRMTVNVGELKPLTASADCLLVPVRTSNRTFSVLVRTGRHYSFPRCVACLIASGKERVLGVDAGVRTRVVPLNQVDLLGESGFKVIQVFRIDLLCLRDKLVHLGSHLSLNLQLLHVRDVVCQRVLPKEVPD